MAEPFAIRPKSSAVEAMRFDGDRRRMFEWLAKSAMDGNFGYVNGERMDLQIGDYAVKTSDGKFFRVRAATFDELYDRLEPEHG